MRPGKFSESVLKRSVLKQIKTKREEVLTGAGVGSDCSFFVFGEGEGTLLSVSSIVVEEIEDLSLGIIAAVNNVAAAAGEPVGIAVSSLLPDKILESVVQRYSAEAEKACHILGIQIAGGNTMITGEVKKPIFTISVIGKKKVSMIQEEAVYEGGEDIILTKWVGLAGTAVLAEKKEKELSQRLPHHLIQEAKEFSQMISVLSEGRVGIRCKVKKMHDVSRGGILAALWELVEDTGMGLTADLKKIPIRQETIEICELLEVNPYELYGAGSLLMVTSNTAEVLEQLEREHIPAKVIGRITRDKARVLWNGEEKRFLDRPRTEALEILRKEEE